MVPNQYIWSSPAAYSKCSTVLFLKILLTSNTKISNLFRYTIPTFYCLSFYSFDWNVLVLVGYRNTRNKPEIKVCKILWTGLLCLSKILLQENLTFFCSMHPVFQLNTLFALSGIMFYTFWRKKAVTHIVRNPCSFKNTCLCHTI